MSTPPPEPAEGARELPEQDPPTERPVTPPLYRGLAGPAEPSMPVRVEATRDAPVSARPHDAVAQAFVEQAPRRPESPPKPDPVVELGYERTLRSLAGLPTSWWGRAVHTVTGGTVNPGDSRPERRRRELRALATAPLDGHRRVAVLCLKGGVGKTTVAFGVGAALAQAREDRVIAVDANAERGTLGGRTSAETAATVRRLLDDQDDIQRYYDVRRYTNQGPSRLEVLANEAVPSASTAITAADFARVAAIVERFYAVSLVDCGAEQITDVLTGKGGILDRAHQLVVVCSAAGGGTRAAADTLDWLDLYGYQHLTGGAVVATNMARGGAGRTRTEADRLRGRLRARWERVSVVPVPFDNHLAADGVIDLDLLRPDTRDAFLSLAAEVGSRFPESRSPAGDL